jgi:predicted RNase H-like nuclease (RuvC/YqgF family)
MAALVRQPNSRETATALAPLAAKGAGSRRQAFEDVLWSIFNSKEFLFNH